MKVRFSYVQEAVLSHFRDATLGGSPLETTTYASLGPLAFSPAL